MVESQLVAHALLIFAERDDALTDRRHMLANRAVRTFNEGRVDLPARGGQHPLDSGEGAEHHTVAHANHASTPILFDHLRIEQRGQWHPAGLRGGTLSLPARWLYPGPEVGQERGGIFLEPVGE